MSNELCMDGVGHCDDFIAFYGLAPFANPHGDVLLFPDLVAALEWYFDRSAVAQMLPQTTTYYSINQSTR